MHTIVTQTAKIWLAEDGIVHLEPHARREQDLNDAKENVAAVQEIAGGVKRGLLIHFQIAVAQTAECRNYYTSEAAFQTVRAVAIVTKSTLGRIIGNLMIGMNTSPTPLRLFESDEAALEWLRASDSTSAQRNAAGTAPR
jgi:hypothetical protein